MSISESVTDQIRKYAETLDQSRLNELNAYAVRVRAGQPAPRPEYDPDPVLPLVKASVGLTRQELKRMHTMLGKLIAGTS